MMEIALLLVSVLAMSPQESAWSVLLTVTALLLSLLATRPLTCASNVPLMPNVLLEVVISAVTPAYNVPLMLIALLPTLLVIDLLDLA